MYIPELQIEPILIEDNAKFICNFLSPSKQENQTRPFLEKTIAMYPELKEAITIQDDSARNALIYSAVSERLQVSQKEIEDRIIYFRNKFSLFMNDFILAQCSIYNYQWKKEDAVIHCYVGYLPFYPRSTKEKCFYISYNDEERVFSGAVHEINHMIFYEKWNEMHGQAYRKERFWPDPLWFLEEIVVDPTLNDERVKPYTLYENRAYEQFYLPLIENRSIMSYVKQMYESKSSIEGFLEEAYKFVCNNKEIIKSCHS